MYNNYPIKEEEDEQEQEEEEEHEQEEQQEQEQEQEQEGQEQEKELHLEGLGEGNSFEDFLHVQLHREKQVREAVEPSFMLHSYITEREIHDIQGTFHVGLIWNYSYDTL